MKNIDFLNKKQYVGIGISIPFNKSVKGVFETIYTTKQQMLTNFKNLILTSKRERINNPNFGTNIKRYLFEHIEDDALNNIRTDIEAATAEYCPYIIIQSVKIRKFETLNVFVIEINFNIANDSELNSVTLNISDSSIQLI